MKKMTPGYLAARAEEYPEGVSRPRSRVDCSDIERPCPFVSCRYHLYLDVNPDTGSLKFNFPDIGPEDLVDSCALDLIDAHGDMSLEDIGEYMNVTRERIRQIEETLLDKVRENGGQDLEETWN